jgi:hypothetical protein
VTTFAPADVEAAVVGLLGGHAAGVGTKVPASRPASFTRVQRQGGSRTNLILSAPRVFVECWGATQVEAFDRAADTWAALSDAEGTNVGGVWFARVELTDLANFPDDDGSPRYTFTAGITTALRSIP